MNREPFLTPAMVMSAASHRSTTSMRALAVLSVFTVLVSDVEGRHHVCPPFSCGGFSDISYPFRRQGDPHRCGVKSYELVCTDTNASIRIGSGTYNVLDINYNYSYFWIVDDNMGMQSSCPLPRWDYYQPDRRLHGESHHSIELDHDTEWATFVNCSRPIENNGMYEPVACLSTNSSFIYVVTAENAYVAAYDLEPSCGYLAMTPLGGPYMTVPDNTSYPEVVKFMRKGFTLEFPFTIGEDLRECLDLADVMSDFRKEQSKYRILVILMVDLYFWQCIANQLRSTNPVTSTVLTAINIVLPFAMWILKSLHVICRFVLMPLAVFIFLAYKYWKTRITIDAVEKFLRMQQMLVPMRYAYTDIIAITGHFREKLGQGGYGSVYKGVLLQVKFTLLSRCWATQIVTEKSLSVRSPPLARSTISMLYASLGFAPRKRAGHLSMSSCPVDLSISTYSHLRGLSHGTNLMRLLWALPEVSTTCIRVVICRSYTLTSSHTTSFLTATLFQKLLILGSPNCSQETTVSCHLAQCVEP